MILAGIRKSIQPPRLAITLRPSSKEARRHQRRRWRAVGALLVAVTLAIGLVIGLNGSSSKGRSPGVQEPPVTFAGVASTDHGAVRLVGFHGLQIAVSARWRLEDQRCGTAVADTVLFPDVDTEACLLERRGHFTVVMFYELKSAIVLGWGKAALRQVVDDGQKVSVGWLAPREVGRGCLS